MQLQHHTTAAQAAAAGSGSAHQETGSLARARGAVPPSTTS